MNLAPAALFGPLGLNASLFGRKDKGQSSNTAQNTFADLTREQWADYVNTFVPIENQLIAEAMDPNAANEAMTSASQNVSDAFSTQQGATDRRVRGLGLQLTADQRTAADRATNLSKSLTDVGAQNAARDMTLQRQQSILGNPAPT
jgi:hypothetical protein